MVDNQSVAQHFDIEERAFVSQATDWIQTVSNEYRIVVTHFLNPRERHILDILIGDRTDIKTQSFGIFDKAEKERMVLAPDFIDISLADFDEKLLQVHFAKKFVELRHKDLLGAFLSAGIDRAVFGDILLDKEKGIAQVAVEGRQETFIEQEIQQIGKVKADWQSLSFDQALVREEEGEERFILLPSLRLDAVVATTFNLSRAQVKELIDAGLVAVNWSKSKTANRTIHVHDVISVRKKGRISLQSLAGHSKSDKIKAVFQIIHR